MKTKWYLLLTLVMALRPVWTHQIFNYTWVIINEAGDIAFTNSTLASTTPWPNLTPDLCDLAAGASAAWGLPDIYLPQPTLPPNHNKGSPQHPGCSHQTARSRLRESDFYVCPGGHRERALNHRCGYRESFFCASWGCETTGNAHWHPRSTWDYITVNSSWKPPYTSPNAPYHVACDSGNTTTKGRCTPLTIAFTDAGKRADLNGWFRGHEWGLRLYISGTDPGLTFKIKLLRSVPNEHNPVVLGPVAPRPRGPTGPGPSDATPLSTSTVFQAVLPPVSPSTGEILKGLANVTAESLNSTEYNECWLCFSPVPPFYDGIAVLANASTDLILTNSSDRTRWADSSRFSRTSPGLTLTQISGIGLCIHSSLLRLPPQLEPICNTSFSPPLSHEFLVAPNGTYFACSFGVTPSVSPRLLMSNKEYCVLVMLMPKISIHPTEDLLPYHSSSTRAKREPVTAITLSVLLGLGATGAGTGIASIITSKQHYYALSQAIDKDIQNLQEGLDSLKESVVSLSEVVLQNRRGLDLLFLREGGLCAALKEECCFYKDKTGLVQDSIDKVKKNLEARQKQREKDEAWYKSWTSATPWLTTLIPTVLGPLAGFFLLVSLGPWALRKLTAFIREQVDQLIKPAVAVHYHRLTTCDEESYTEPTTAPGLRFSTLQTPQPWYYRLLRRT